MYAKVTYIFYTKNLLNPDEDLRICLISYLVAYLETADMLRPVFCPLKNQVELQANVTVKNLGVLLFS